MPHGGERVLLHEAAILPVLLVLGVVLLEVLLAAVGLAERLTELLPEGLGGRLTRPELVWPMTWMAVHCHVYLVTGIWH